MTDLEALIAQAVREDGLAELTLRVSRYAELSGAMGEPAAWQAIAKYQGREAGPWGVGVRASPVAALRAALETGRAGGVLASGPDMDVFG